MSFNPLEWSLFKGKPQRLYRFSIAPLVLGYTSFESAVTANNVTFQPAQITDDGIRQKGEPSADRLKISAPLDFEPARHFLAGKPTITLQVLDKHKDSAETRLVWHGEVEEVNQPNGASCEVFCRPLGSKTLTGLSLSWSRECPHTLFDKNCQVRPEDFKQAFSVQSNNARQLITSPEIAAYADNWFSGGYIEWQTPQGLLFTRGIARHAGNQLNLISPAPIVYGQPCFAYAGCNQLIATCQGKFNNLVNCGAFPHLPGKSPFDGDPIF